MSHGFPHDGYPTSWWQVLWSDELAPGAVAPLRYLGTDLVAFRTSDGQVSVFDAYCPHMGAHLGHGGRVDSGELVCPFHGWRWRPDGTNAAIPYSRRASMPIQARTWTVSESGGAIWVWYDRASRAPLWPPPSVPESEQPQAYYPMRPAHTRHWAKQRFHPQYVAENTVDAAHFELVHNSKDATIVQRTSAEGPLFYVDHQLTLGGKSGTTWLTPDGNVTSTLCGELFGLGVSLARFTLPNGLRWVHWQAQTPIDSEHCALWAGVMVSRGPGGSAGSSPAGPPDEPPALIRTLIDNQLGQVERDFRIWEHMRYEPHPPLPPEEVGPVKALRRWAEQFYPDIDATADAPVRAAQGSTGGSIHRAR
jgi:nitrite reductase/ring-hydroxylating ferredoxin subunit